MRKFAAIVICLLSACAVGEVTEGGSKVCTDVQASVDDTCTETSDAPEIAALTTYCNPPNTTCPTNQTCRQGVNGLGQIQYVCVPRSPR